MKRVCLDARRMDAGGIARVSEALISALAASDRFETVVLRPQDAPHVAGVRRLAIDHAPLSEGDLKELGNRLTAEHVDLFVAPQFYAPLGIAVPMVSWVHDVWPLSHPEWLPNLESLSARHGYHTRRAGEQVLAAYRSAREAGRLFPGNAYLSRIDVEPDGVPAWNAAMFALNLARCTHVVTCSLTSQGELLKLFPEIAPRISVVQNPLPGWLTAPPLAAREELLLHVSKWERRKNIPRLVRAFARLAQTAPELRLALVGAPVTPGDEAEIRAVIAETGISDRIECLGNLSDAALAKLYGRARGFVMPSLDEGFSIPLLEAMVAGLPIAAARAGAIPEIARDAALYFDPHNEAEMAEVMAHLLDVGQTDALCAKGRARLRQIAAHDFGAAVRAVVGTLLDRQDGAL